MKIVSLAIIAAIALIFLLHAPIVPVLLGCLFAAVLLAVQSKRSHSLLKSVVRETSRS